MFYWLRWKENFLCIILYYYTQSCWLFELIWLWNVLTLIATLSYAVLTPACALCHLHNSLQKTCHVYVYTHLRLKLCFHEQQFTPSVNNWSLILWVQSLAFKQISCQRQWFFPNQGLRLKHMVGLYSSFNTDCNCVHL